MDPQGLAATRLDDERRRLAARIWHANVSGHVIPHVPGMPGGLAAARVAARVAPDVLDALADLYDVTAWTQAAYEKAVLDGALAGWRPGTLVDREPGRLRVVACSCPLSAEVERDPRVCAMCRITQERLAQAALPGSVDVTFTRLVSRGDGACEADIRYDAHPERTNALPATADPHASLETAAPLARGGPMAPRAPHARVEDGLAMADASDDEAPARAGVRRR